MNDKQLSYFIFIFTIKLEGNFKCCALIKGVENNIAQFDCAKKSRTYFNTKIQPYYYKDSVRLFHHGVFAY